MKRILLSLLALFFLILLLLSPGTALEGARKGLLLWAYTVLPTLLPFMIGTGVIAAMGAVGLVVKPFSPLLSGVFHFSQPAGFVFLTGLLCGYPMGAKMDRDLLERGQISWEEACYLLSICNHPSPMFLTGYTVMEGHYYDKKSKKNRKIRPSVWSGVSHTAPISSFSLDEHLMSCLETMEKIGLYIMLFSILSLYLFKLPLPGPVILKPALMGLLEITTGIQTICEHTSGLTGLLLVTASVAFGGISGIFQTRSVLTMHSGRKNAGLSIRHYIFWKALHSLLSCVFFWILLKI